MVATPGKSKSTTSAIATAAIPATLPRDCSSYSASGCSSDSSSDDSSDIDFVVDMALAPGTRRYRGRICAAPASIDTVDFKTRYRLTMDKFLILYTAA